MVSVYRWDFLKTKLSTILLLSVASTIFIFLIGLTTGLIYSPYKEFDEIMEYMIFIPAYFLELFGFLVEGGGESEVVESGRAEA